MKSATWNGSEVISASRCPASTARETSAELVVPWHHRSYSHLEEEAEILPHRSFDGCAAAKDHSVGLVSCTFRPRKGKSPGGGEASPSATPPGRNQE